MLIKTRFECRGRGRKIFAKRVIRRRASDIFRYPIPQFSPTITETFFKKFCPGPWNKEPS